MQEVKGISELFAWQAQCLLSSAVQNRQNLLYSLPTSGGEYFRYVLVTPKVLFTGIIKNITFFHFLGKTLVAEIIMLQELLCYK